MPRSGFTAGLITGGIIGTVLALAFAPRTGADLRRSVTGAAKDLGAAAAQRYQDASAGIGETLGQLTDNAQAVRNDAADAVASGADRAAQLPRHSGAEAASALSSDPARRVSPAAQTR